VYVLYSPHIRQLTSFGKLSEAKSEHATGAFFLYIGPLSDDEKLYVSLPYAEIMRIVWICLQIVYVLSLKHY